MNILALKTIIEGEVFTDILRRQMYSTDASIYKEMPKGVVYPKTEEDIRNTIAFCRKNKLSIIPRAAGTSLAGQVVGNGLVVDISKYMNGILTFDKKNHTVKVQPGVIRDELNLFLKPHKVFFSPETSTSNRCTIGGMVGNNACGTHSLIYGSTRDHLLKVKMVLCDGSIAVFKPLSTDEYQKKLSIDTFEGDIYRYIHALLANKENRKTIQKNFPNSDIARRNMGYAIDLLLDTEPFGGHKKINLSTIIAGSEGTLGFITEITLKLSPLPSPHTALICIHHKTIQEAYNANNTILKNKPSAIELLDKTILEISEKNRAQEKNRFFINGKPDAILAVEIIEETDILLNKKIKHIISNLKAQKLGYHYEVLKNNTEINKVWELRKAALGIFSNMHGRRKPIALIEDTAVLPKDLPNYMKEVDALLAKHNFACVYYAHISTGELHLRPVVDLKDNDDIKRMENLATEMAMLVKKYRGSLSGEHGDGRLRGSFIPMMFGKEVYSMFVELKKAFDPDNIFNPNKIVNSPNLKENLRYIDYSSKNQDKKRYFYTSNAEFVFDLERCNGSADCRKTAAFTEGMCPTYKATNDEIYSTRGRANILREYFSNSEKFKNNLKKIKKILDLCLSCKACKTECPSSVDITKYKAEFLQHYYDKHHIPLNAYLIANYPIVNSFFSKIPAIYNFFVSKYPFSYIVKYIMGFHKKRKIPQLPPQSCIKEIKKLKTNSINNKKHKTVYLYIDEFTNFSDVSIGKIAYKLLCQLNYEVKLMPFVISGRTYLSKGMLQKAKKIINRNLELYKKHIDNNAYIIGIEPSALFSFKDEYIDLADNDKKTIANNLSKKCMLIDDFIVKEHNVRDLSFVLSKEKKEVLLHGHCYQKALADTENTKKMLQIGGYNVTEIKSGCCGMAGAYGYEKKNYDISMQIGEIALFPAVRKSKPNEEIAAAGTSCRQQIFDGTGKKALHPIELFYKALLENKKKL